MTENAEIKRGRLERDDCAREINNTARDEYKNDTAHARDIENTPHVLNSIQREQVQVPNRERDKFNNNYKEISKDITLFKKFVRQETKKYFSSLIKLLNCNSPIFTHFFFV